MSSLLIKGATVLPMTGPDNIYVSGEIAVEGSEIVCAGPPGSVPRDFTPERVIDASGKAAIPGLVNCHTHASMTLLRGYADDLPLMKWLKDKIWPLEAKLTPEDIYWGALLSCLEMIKSGTTAFADMYFVMDMVAKAVLESGLRACLSRGMIGVGPQAEAAVEESVSFFREWQGAAGGRIKVMFGPHAPYTCPPDYLKRVADLASRCGAGIHIHVAETKDEIEQIQELYGNTPVKHLWKTGLFEVPVLAAHCVHLDGEDVEILAENQVAVAHCPQSNMKLASGISPVERLLARGVTVGIGTDGAASNNNLDMVEEMRTAALLQKVYTGDPTALPAYTVLEMATRGGALALGLEDVGCLAPGMKADIVLIDLHRPHLFPRHDIAAHLVYAAQASDVDTVIVDGKIIMEKRRVLTLDEERVMACAQERAFDLVRRS